MKIEIFPRPRSFKLAKGTLDTSALKWITIPSGISDTLHAHIKDFKAVLSKAGINSELQAGKPGRGKSLLNIALDPKKIPAQGFRVTSRKTGVSIQAADEAGVYYALGVLKQVLEQCRGKLPLFNLSDHPDFPQRGIMHDVSRAKVPTMETLLQLIDQLAEMRINEFQLYIEHTFAFSAHETVWKQASPFTAEEILELDRYCRERYIKLVPNLNSFGHFERWLKYKSYHKYAECPDGFEYPWEAPRSEVGSVLKPNQASLDLIDSLYHEYLPNFSGELLNVGCDETWELGQGWSKKLADKVGSTRVYFDHLKKIYKLTKKHGRKMMFWGDIILHQPQLIKELPKDVIALEWGYEDNHKFDERCGHFAKAKIPFYVCPGTSSWNTLIGRSKNCLGNLAIAAINGKKHGAIGYLNTDWGDGGHHQYLPVSYLGYAAGAAYSWNYQANKSVDFATPLNRVFFKGVKDNIGKLLIDMGNLYLKSSFRIFNGNIFNHCLFCVPSEIKNEIKVSDLKKCLQGLENSEALARGIRSHLPAAKLAKAEMLSAIAMCKFAIEKGIGARGGKAVNRGTQRRQMTRIATDHKKCWLARNRPGGMQEGLRRLKKFNPGV